MRSLTLLWKRAVQLYTRDIWQPSHMGKKSLRGISYAILRVISITITGIFATRAFARAAALSFTSLLSLGPLIALAVLVAGFVFKDPGNQDMVAQKMTGMIRFIAPQVEHYEDLNRQQPASPPAASPAAPDVSTPASAPGATPAPPQLQPGERRSRPDNINRLISSFAAGARSGTAGGLSFVTLIVIVILLFGAIEDVFNDIWGVRRTRSWLTRVVFYWAILTLGTVLFALAITTFSAATFTSFFKEKLSFGSDLIAVMRFLIPVVAGAVVVGLITLFYRFVPNTHVYWRAAFAGAMTMCLLLLGNNMLAFAYFKRIELTRNLYGSVGIMPVLMLGLYIFWFIVLVGGQVSYAVQNVHFRNSQVAWNTLSHNTRERLTLVVMLTIARRFHACLPPCTVSQLADTIKAPAQILNACLNRLVDLKLVSPVPPAAKDEASSNFLYQPARPLNRITLGDFKELFENLGEDPSSSMLDQIDPVATRYQSTITELNHGQFFSKTLEEVFAENPIEDTHPPFALGEKIA